MFHQLIAFRSLYRSSTASAIKSHYSYKIIIDGAAVSTNVGWVCWKMREYYKMGEGQSYRNQFDCWELKRYGYSASRGPSCASIDWCSITCSESRSKCYLTVSHLLPKLSPSLELKTSTANPLKRLARHLRPTLFFWRSTLIAECRCRLEMVMELVYVFMAENLTLGRRRD